MSDNDTFDTLGKRFQELKKETDSLLDPKTTSAAECEMTPHDKEIEKILGKDLISHLRGFCLDICHSDKARGAEMEEKLQQIVADLLTSGNQEGWSWFSHAAFLYYADLVRVICNIEHLYSNEDIIRNVRMFVLKVVVGILLVGLVLLYVFFAFAVPLIRKILS
ncbi:hypothetical protein WICPIJ_005874 [Wickerhamomyces pijperi]|uniref:Transmembrane protein n=1 Tax=Wickerhamomyces pijperi TaxID=599730 RepID=A0A9P8TLD8_WICPI|nr:hypothetical protein WICPIJ_005874 [Wickerhamomyces pijperi]